jgi:molybdopterin converting factor small subunit
MNISVKCFSSLHNGDTCRHDRDHTVSLSSETSTVKTLADHVRVPEQDIALVFVNGRRAEIDNHLADGDRVAFVPAVGGM